MVTVSSSPHPLSKVRVRRLLNGGVQGKKFRHEKADMMGKRVSRTDPQITGSQ